MQNLLKIIKNEMKWGDFLVIGLILVLGFSLWINLVSGFSSDFGAAEVVVRGEVIAKYNLETMEKEFQSDKIADYLNKFDEEITGDRITLHMTSSGIDFDIILENGKIRFHESNCPDQVCVNTGFIHRSGEIAACVPAGVLVRVVGSYGESDPDFIAG